MKVVYEKSIEEKILDAKQQSKIERKCIEYILITEEEALELYERYFIDLSCPWAFGELRGTKIREVNNGMMYDIKIKVEGL
jgi:hypothetical protein